LTVEGRDPLAGRIPIILITGFLGSGKTTLLGRLLRHPGMDRAAAITTRRSRWPAGAMKTAARASFSLQGISRGKRWRLCLLP
jgi:molybdopterin-guanine dinucleotide biosynthesis protein